MKNEANTQHTPTWHNDKQFNQIADHEGKTIVLSWGKSATQKDKELIARAPELLKENHSYANEIGKLRVQNESLQALNAELLEALKAVTKSINNKGWFDKISEATMNQALSAIAKAETKTLVGS